MKKFLCAFALVFGIALSGFAHAQTSISLANCKSWREAINATKQADLDLMLAKIQETNEAIPALHKAQKETKTWTGNRDIISKNWDNLTLLTELDKDWNEVSIDILKQPWETQDLEYIYAVRACNDAIKADVGSAAEKALLQKATLHIERATLLLKKIHTAKRMPMIRHGGILPGTTEEGEAADYLENRFIPKFVNAALVFMISLSVVMLIIGGVMFLVAGGDSDLTARAKTTVGWSIIGVVITILSYAIVQFIIGIDFSL